MSVLVYQVIGKLDGYPRVEYEIDGKVYSENLPSSAIYSHYGGMGEIVYICPQSLVEQIELIEKEETLKKFLKEKLLKYAGDRVFDVLLVSSIGKYSIQGVMVYFDSHPGNITLQIFFDMLSRLKRFKDSEGLILVIDISTGYNFYIPPLLEALRGVIVMDKLSNALRSNIQFKQTISEPVRDGVNHLKLFINEYDAKAFFELPKIDHRLHIYVEEDEKVKEDVSRKHKDLQRDLEKLLENLKLAFNAIKFNAPLALYMKSLVDLSIDVENLKDKLIGIYGDILKPKVEDRIVKTVKLKEKAIINLFYALALYKWLSKEFRDLVEEPTTRELKERFGRIYQEIRLPLNERFLERDLREIEGLKDNITTQWKTIKEVKMSQRHSRGRGEAFKKSDEKRNFFAHSGLEENVTMVRKINDEIKMKYKEERLKDIKAWLLEPEK